MKRKKRELERLTKNEWKKLIQRFPQGERFNRIFDGWNDGYLSYYAEQNQRLYRIRHREGISLLNIFQFRCWKQDSWYGDRVEPVVVEDNIARQNVYAVIFLDNPRSKKKVEQMEMSVVLRDPDYAVGTEEWEQRAGYKKLLPKHQMDHLVEEVTRYDKPSSPIGSDADIFINLHTLHAELVYNSISPGWPRNAVSRAYSLDIYRGVLWALEQKEGTIHYRSSNETSPPILDTGR